MLNFLPPVIYSLFSLVDMSIFRFFTFAVVSAFTFVTVQAEQHTVALVSK